MKNLLVIIAVISCVSWSDSAGPKKKPFEPTQPWRVSENPRDRAFSTLKGDKVRMMPSNVTFNIPKDWMDIGAKYGGNVYVTKEDLDSRATGKTSLTKEFASVSNAVFPYDRCAASAGRWQWDHDNSAFHLRVYELAEPLDQVLQRIETKASEEIVRVTGIKCVAKRIPHGSYYRILIESSWSNGEDPPGPVYFDCYAMRAKSETIVFAFMYGGSDNRKLDDIHQVLYSADFSESR